MSTLADRIRGIIRAPGSAGRPDDPPHQIGPDAPGANGPGLPFPETGSGLDDVRAVLGGDWLRQYGAPCFVVETRRTPASSYGRDVVGALASRLADAAAAAPLVARMPATLPFVFFDLETTGLGGAAGTYAFLVGCGWFDDDGGFVTRQYLLVRLADERALLAAVGGELARAGALVSFNGKSFDMPMLETRYLYHRLESAAAGRPHLDMLHVARRFWRGATDLPAAASNCSLSALERDPLGTGRQGDVPGSEIPARYFHFVRTGDARPLRVVFEHNRLDLLSLAALTARALHLVRMGPEQVAEPREALALGWLYARAGDDALGRRAYQRAIDLSSEEGRWAAPSSALVRVEALRSLALMLRRGRAHDQAAGCWRQILNTRGCPGQIAREANAALAIHHEHRVRDLAAAKDFALRSLEHGTRQGWHDAVRHRVARLERKMSRFQRGALLD
ncbi:MAG: ribonuclease H-like domain-containing protein [Acidobacteriota bacterium]